MNHKRKRGRYHGTSRSRASDYVYPEMPGDKRQALPSAIRRAVAALADIRAWRTEQ